MKRKKRKKKYIFARLSRYKESLSDNELVRFFSRLLILHKKDPLEMLFELDLLPISLKKIFFNGVIPQVIHTEENFKSTNFLEKATKMLLKDLYCYAPDVLQLNE